MDAAVSEHTEAPPVNVDKLPNFDAVRALIGDPRVLRWLDRLKRWCEFSMDEREAEQSANADYMTANENMAHELANQRDAEQLLAEVRERLADTRRGMYDWEQTLDWIERNV